MSAHLYCSVLYSCLCVGGWILHLLFGTVFVNCMIWAWEGQCLDKNLDDGWMDVWDVLILWMTSGFVLDDMTELAMMADDILWFGMAHEGHVNWGTRVTHWRPLPWVEVRSSRITWLSVEANWLCRRWLTCMQAACVATSNVWLVKTNLSLRSDEATKSDEKWIWGLSFS